MHVHVQGPSGEAKFRMKPRVELARSSRLSGRELRTIEHIIQERKDEITSSWRRHFAD